MAFYKKNPFFFNFCKNFRICSDSTNLGKICHNLVFSSFRLILHEFVDFRWNWSKTSILSFFENVVRTLLKFYMVQWLFSKKYIFSFFFKFLGFVEIQQIQVNLSQYRIYIISTHFTQICRFHPISVEMGQKRRFYHFLKMSFRLY